MLEFFIILFYIFPWIVGGSGIDVAFSVEDLCV